MPYRRSLKIYEKVFSPFSHNSYKIECKQIHLQKSALDEIYRRRPEKLSVVHDRIVYTLIEEKEYYTILLPSRKDYNEFVKRFNERISIKEAERKDYEEEQNINRVWDDAHGDIEGD